MKPRPSFLRKLPFPAVILAGAVTSSITPSAPAASTYWWDTNTTGLWSTNTNWWTTAGGTSNPVAAPVAADSVVFNGTGKDGTTIVQLGAATSIAGITFANTGTTTFNTVTSDRALTIGTGGITINSGAGAVTFGANATNQKITFSLGGNQTWANNSSTALVLNGGNTTSMGSSYLTIGGSGDTNHAGQITGTGGLTKSGAGTLTLSNSGTSFTGVVTMDGGIVDATTFAAVNTNSSIGKGSATSNAGDLVFGGGTLRHSAASAATTNRLFTLGDANGLTATLDSSAASATNSLSFTGTGSIALGGSGARSLTLTGSNTGANTFAPVLGDGSGGTTSLVKSGAGTWTISGANTYTGATTVSAGTLQLTGTTGALNATSGLTVTGSTFIDGDTTTAANNNSVADRIKTATTLSLNGGIFQLAAAAASNTHAQSFDSLSLGAGDSTLNTNAATGTNTLTFSGSGTTNYARVFGSMLNINTQTGFNVAFTNAPANNVSGSGSDAILVGAALNGSDFIKAAAGNVAAATYTTTGTTTWTAGKNMDVTGTSGSAYAAADVNSVRFNTANPYTVTLATGTSTIAGGILVSSAVSTNLSTITGGTIQGAAGKDLLVIQNNASGGLTIGSVIADNSTSGLTKTGVGAVALTGANTYAGATVINSGTLQLGNGTTGNDGSLLTSGITNNSALVYNLFGSQSVSTPTSGTGTLTKAGAGILTITNSTNSYAGATNIDQGTLAFTANQNLSGGLNFGSAAGTTTTGTLDLSGANATFAGAMVVNSNSSTANTVTIGSGKTLTVNNNVTIGYNASATSKLTLTGSGSFTMVKNGGEFRVGGNIATSANLATLDMSGLSSFSADLGVTGKFIVGDNSTSSSGNGVSTLYLATNSTIKASSLAVEHDGSNFTQAMHLGSGTTEFDVDTLLVGASGTGGRGSGLMDFNTSAGTLKLRGSSGSDGSKTAVSVGYTVVTTSVNTTAKVDLNNHSVDLNISTLSIGQKSGGTGGNDSSFLMNQGTMSADAVTIGNRTSTTPNAGILTGTLTIGGGTVTIAGGITLGANALASSTAANANLSITGGTVTVGGNIAKGSTTGTVISTITLNGGTLDMGTKNIGASGAGAIDTLTLSSGTLKNVGEINGGGGITKGTAGTLIFDGTNTYTGTTTVSGGKLTVASTGTINSTGGVSIGAGEFNYNSSTAMTQGVSFSGTGGKLSGSGTISPALSVPAGNTLAPAAQASGSRMALGSTVAFGSGSIFEWDLNAATTDASGSAPNQGTYGQVAATGAASGTAVFTIVLGSNSYADAFWNSNKSWTNVFAASGMSDLTTLFTTFSGADLTATGSGSSAVATASGQGYFSFSGTTLNWTAVPEPSGALAGILLGAGLLRRRRNR